jgi:hypothetical protein
MKHGEIRDHHYEDESGQRAAISGPVVALHSVCETYCAGCKQWIRTEGVMGALKFMAEHDAHRPKLTYAVKFRIAASERGVGRERSIFQEVVDTKKESSNMSAALAGAALLLDSEGFDHWSLLGIAKVTS